MTKKTFGNCLPVRWRRAEALPYFVAEVRLSGLVFPEARRKQRKSPLAGSYDFRKRSITKISSFWEQP